MPVLSFFFFPLAFLAAAAGLERHLSRRSGWGTLLSAREKVLALVKTGRMNYIRGQNSIRRANCRQSCIVRYLWSLQIGRGTRFIDQRLEVN